MAEAQVLTTAQNVVEIVIPGPQGPKGDAWSGVPRRPGDGLNRSVSGGIPPALPEGDDEDEEEGGLHRKRATSKAGSVKAGEEDDDRIDAKNAASRLATTTF